MGRRIIALAVESGEFELAAAIEKKGHPEIGRDAGQVAGMAPLNVTVNDSWSAGSDVAIDFSLPEATDATLEACTTHQTPLILGTTGLGDRQQDAVKAAATKIPIVYGTNMSMGMNVLFALVGKAAAMLGEEYDIEIVEQHHRFKKDAPSGSALTLAEKICQSTGRDYPNCLTHGRSGKEALREKGTIGMHAVRAGDITGVHSVLYSTLGETITLSHTAHNRDMFVRGALRAAKWLIGKEAGLYPVANALGVV
jgi:4-hydroxy-tetrahydrodipicolinate reductase